MDLHAHFIRDKVYERSKIVANKFFCMTLTPLNICHLSRAFFARIRHVKNSFKKHFKLKKRLYNILYKGWERELFA